MALSKHVFTDGDPWPFKDMEVGDVVICTHTQKPANISAHAYGYAVRKVFSTKRVVNKDTGAVGYRIERLPDNTPRNRHRVQKPRRASGGRRSNARVWPFESLGVGESWVCKTPEDVPAAVAAALGINRTATAQWRREQIAKGMAPALAVMQRRKLYATQARVDAVTRQYVSATITRLPDELRPARGITKDAVGVEKRFGPAPAQPQEVPKSLAELVAGLQALAGKGA